MSPSFAATTAVIARDDQFADVLSGNALAVAKGGPSAVAASVVK